MNFRSFFVICLLGPGLLGYAQSPGATAVNKGTSETVQAPSLNAGDPASGFSAESYILGPGDTMTIYVPDLDDQFTTDKTFRIDNNGDVTVPFAGRLHAAGLSVELFEREIERHLLKVLRKPQAVVTVQEFHSQPVSVFGEVTAPGLHQVQAGAKTLFAAISLAGGFTENLGSTIEITRNLKWGPIPLPGAHNDASGQYSVASLQLKSILKATDPAANIPVMPDDVIAVSRSEVVYAVGAVTTPGGFPLGQNESMSSLQVLALAQGLQRTASPERAVILRVQPGLKTRAEIPVNVKKLLAGNGLDVPLRAEDILFIPSSATKVLSYRTFEAAIATATGLAIYGKY